MRYTEVYTSSNFNIILFVEDRGNLCSWWVVKNGLLTPFKCTGISRKASFLLKQFCSFNAVQCQVCFGLTHLTACAVYSRLRDWSDNMLGCGPAFCLVHNNCGDHAVPVVCVSPPHQWRIDSLSLTSYCFSFKHYFQGCGSCACIPKRSGLLLCIHSSPFLAKGMIF